MKNILVEHGRSYEEVEEKLKTQLHAMYEICADVMKLKIRSHHAVKAINGIRRLKGKTKSNDLQVSFNSKYFI